MAPYVSCLTHFKDLHKDCVVWKGFPAFPVECNPGIPVAPGEEHYVLDKSLDEVYFALQ